MKKFENGSRVVFLGDSITANGRWIRRVLDYYRKETDIRFEAYNAGVPGDKAAGALRRRQDTVLCYEPTDVVVMLGMNGIGRSFYSGPATSEAVLARRSLLGSEFINITVIVEKFLKEGLRVTLVSPTIYDELTDSDTPNDIGVESALYELSSRLSVYAEEKGIDFVDMHTQMFAVHKKMYKNGDESIIRVSDRVHPTEEGQELIAAIFLNAQGFDVAIPDTQGELRELLARPHDEWEERRFLLERRVVDSTFIDRCVFGGVKKSEDVLRCAEKLVSEGANDYVKERVKSYTDFAENGEKYKAELIAHTKTVMDN